MNTQSSADRPHAFDYERARRFVRGLAAVIRARLPRHVDLEELVAAGNLGYAESLQRWRADCGARFETFAQYRVKGAILDAVRRMARDASRCAPLEVVIGETDTGSGGASNEAGAAGELRRRVIGLVTGCPSEGVGAPHHTLEAVHEVGADCVAEQHEQIVLLRCALAALSAADRQLLTWIHQDELSLSAIGARLGRDKAVVCRRHRAALERLRAAFLAQRTVPASQSIA